MLLLLLVLLLLFLLVLLLLLLLLLLLALLLMLWLALLLTLASWRIICPSDANLPYGIVGFVIHTSIERRPFKKGPFVFVYLGAASIKGQGSLATYFSKCTFSSTARWAALWNTVA